MPDPGSGSEEFQFKLKVVINKEKTKVLFAVIDNNFADVLLSFLTLPLGSILQILEDHYDDDEDDDDDDDDDASVTIGSLNSLRKGIESLDPAHFCTDVAKTMLLNPRNSTYAECRKLLINVDETDPIQYYTCEKWNCRFSRTNVIMYHPSESERCECGSPLSREILVRDSVVRDDEEGSGDVFLVNTSSYLISDDLRMLPNVTGSVIRSLKALGVGDTDGAEQRTVTVGYDQIMDLLLGSLLSKSPLTYTILHQGQISKVKSGKYISLSQMEKEETSNSPKFTVTVMVQKSINKLLFAQSKEGFVDFLFSFLTIPLGEVVCLLGGNSSLGSIDNLYESLQKMNADKYVWNQYRKDMLLNPKLPPKFLSENQIFSLTEENHPQLYYYFNNDKQISYLSTIHRNWGHIDCKDPKGGGSYVKGLGMFMVSDDLTVTPLCMLSSLSLLEKKKISIYDVKEMDIEIGLKEGLRILKASLTSTSPLTKALAPIIWKQPHEEQ